LLGVAVHGVAQLLEGFEDVVDGLVVVDLERGVADALEVEGAPFGDLAGGAGFCSRLALLFPRTLEGVLALAVAGDQARAVDLDAAVFLDEAELDCEPEQAAEALDVRRVVALEGGAAVGLEEVREDLERVQGDVPEDIVEDVWLGEIVHHLAG